MLQIATKLLQTVIGWLITKCDKIILQTETTVTLQIVTSLLEIAIGIINCDKFIANCNNYYKLRRLLQIATEKLCDLKEGKGSEIGDSVVLVVQSCSYKFCKIHRKSPVLEVFLMKLQAGDLQLY